MRDAQGRQFAGDPQLAAPGAAADPAPVGDLRKAGGIQEVGRPQVVVPFFQSRGDAGGINEDIDDARPQVARFIDQTAAPPENWPRTRARPMCRMAK
jgi:hypothetical protein